VPRSPRSPTLWLRRQLVDSFGIGRYSSFVLVLLLYFLCLPFSRSAMTYVPVNLLVVASLVLTVRRSWPGRPVSILAIVLAGLSVAPVMGLANWLADVDVASHLAALTLVTLAIVAILRHVLSVEEVTVDIVVGAASVYLLLGLLWASIYALVEHSFPGSFHFPDTSYGVSTSALIPVQHDTILLYYSFETLTTLGTGDVVPTAPPARFLSVLEAVIGQLYLAVLVARFVGLQVSHRRRSAE
jgi:hypothetical protein